MCVVHVRDELNANAFTHAKELTLTRAPTEQKTFTYDGQTLSRDAAGNTLADPAENTSFTYGAHNRMLEAYVGGVLKATYVYNGAGQRVMKIEATGAQRTLVYHYGLDGVLLGETIYNSGGAKIGERDYLWIDALPLAQAERVFSSGIVTSSQFMYVHADQLNTPRLATNGSGTVVWRWDSDAFGIGAANQDPDSDTNLVNVRLRFPGQYLDEETGLHYNYFRAYDPIAGRYIESDPIGLQAGLNTYSYVRGQPTVGIDPFGLAYENANGGPCPLLTYPEYCEFVPDSDRPEEVATGVRKQVEDGSRVWEGVLPGWDYSQDLPSPIRIRRGIMPNPGLQIGPTSDTKKGNEFRIVHSWGHYEVKYQSLQKGRCRCSDSCGIITWFQGAVKRREFWRPEGKWESWDGL